MLFELLVSTLSHLSDAESSLSRSNSYQILVVFCFTAILWCLWRVWVFSLAPSLWPNEPHLLPYSLPLIGHTLSFLNNPEDTINRATKYFPGTEPFALRVGGFRLVIIRDPEHALAVWKDTKALTFDYFIQTSFKGIGVPEKSFHSMFQEQPASFFLDKKRTTSHFLCDNPKNKRYIDIQEDWIREQLAPGPRMDAMSEKFLQYIEESLQTPPSSPKILLNSMPQQKVMSLYNWCRYTLVEAGTKSFLGEEIFDLDTNFVQHYIDWEETSWKVAHQHPAFLSRDMIKARQNLMVTFAKYYSLEPAQRPNLSWLFERMQSEQQKVGLNLNEAASISIIMLWGVHLNTFRILFWTLTHILSDPILKDTVMKETSQARLADQSFSIDHLINGCPTLTAVWNESLRLYNVAAVIRCAEKLTTIGSKTIHPGDRVLGPFRLMHLSQDNFGPDALQFVASRWLKDESLVKKKGYYPFGGGHTYCPGRVIAKQEVCFFIATALHRFEIVPVGEKEDDGNRWKVPTISKKPALTAMDPDGDFFIRVTPKEI